MFAAQVSSCRAPPSCSAPPTHFPHKTRGGCCLISSTLKLTNIAFITNSSSREQCKKFVKSRSANTNKDTNTQGHEAVAVGRSRRSGSEYKFQDSLEPASSKSTPGAEYKRTNSISLLVSMSHLCFPPDFFRGSCCSP